MISLWLIITSRWLDLRLDFGVRSPYYILSLSWSLSASSSSILLFSPATSSNSTFSPLLCRNFSLSSNMLKIIGLTWIGLSLGFFESFLFLNIVFSLSLSSSRRFTSETTLSSCSMYDSRVIILRFCLSIMFYWISYSISNTSLKRHHSESFWSTWLLKLSKRCWICDSNLPITSCDCWDCCS